MSTDYQIKGMDLLCDGNYQVALIISLDAEGYVRKATIDGRYPVPPWERDRNPNHLELHFPPGTAIERDTKAAWQNTIRNGRGEYVTFSDPRPTMHGWTVDMEMYWIDPSDGKLERHSEAINIPSRDLAVWPALLRAANLETP
jgi:hypothetical protein